MKSYFDTSYLVALYVPNEHTDAALRHRARGNRSPILFTPLHRLELRTTVRQCAYTGVISQQMGRQIFRNLDEDLDDGTLLHEPLDWTKTLQRADAVADQQAWNKRCRTLDLWHLAVAIEAGTEIFVTFDQDQYTLAKTVGMRAIVPS